MARRNENLRTIIQGYLHTLPLDGCLGVSLTLKQCVAGAFLDEIRASQNLRQFMNRVNRATYGKAFQRFGRRLNVIPSLESSSSNRLHYHLILQSPCPEDPNRAEQLIEYAWTSTRYGYQQTHVHHQIDHGWTDYITKLKTASDGIDWENFHWR